MAEPERQFHLDAYKPPSFFRPYRPYKPGQAEAKVLVDLNRDLWKDLRDKLYEQGREFAPDRIRIALGLPPVGEVVRDEMCAITTLVPGKGKERINGTIYLVAKDKINWATGNMTGEIIVPPKLSAEDFATNQRFLRPEQLFQLFQDVKGAYVYPFPAGKPNHGEPSEDYYQQSFTS